MQINSTELPFSEDLDLNGNLKEFLLQQQIYRAAIKEIKTKLEILDEEFQARYDHNPIHHMEYRLKSPQSIAGKMQKKGLEITAENIRKNLTDIAGVRVICNYLHDINRIANLLIRQDDITLIERKDYIKNPKESGYRSLHLIVQVPIFLQDTKNLVYVEVQFRTIAMDFWASLEHKMRYKKNIPENHVKYLQDELYDCARQSAELDNRMQNIRNLIAEEAEEEDHCTFVTLPMR